MFAFLFNIQIILAFFPELRTLQQICCRRKRSTSGGCCSGAVLGRPGVPTVSRRQISPFRVWKTTRRKWTSNIETRNSKQKIFLKKTPMYMRIYIFILDCFFFAENHDFVTRNMVLCWVLTPGESSVMKGPTRRGAVSRLLKLHSVNFNF